MEYLDNAIEILKKLNNNGYEAYIVGGFVRDRLLKIKTNDLDITTSAKTDDIKKIFEDVIDSGTKYGGVIVKIKNYEYEVTTFRKDIDYIDHRHPIVEYTDNVKDDLIRRDFTINSLLLDKDLKLYDYLNGVSDLNNHIIRAIGDINKRFNEDALRILRAFYFEAKLGFDIDEETLKAMNEAAIYLENISSDRIIRELKKLLKSKYSIKALTSLYNSNAIDYLHNIKKSIKIAIENGLNCDIIDLLIISKYYSEDISYYQLSKKDNVFINNVINNLDRRMTNYEIFSLGEKVIKKIDYINSALKLHNYNYSDIYSKLVIKDKNELNVDSNILKEKLNICDKNLSKYLNVALRAVLNEEVVNAPESIINYLKGHKENGK